MQWSFTVQTKMLKVVELLKVNGARYRVCGSSVCFWIEVNDYGQLNVVMA
ncbi:MAG: hypothetical protein PHF87_10530 [Desulfotomaculaceae bacterium]|nr:hypothetical protein [Desulfotomaculaceae bacterium]